MPNTLSKAFLKSMKHGTDSADVGGIPFTYDSKAEDLSCGAPSGSEPCIFFSNYLFCLGFKPVPDDFQHGFCILVHKIHKYQYFSENMLRFSTAKAPHAFSSRNSSSHIIKSVLVHIHNTGKM